MRAIERLLSGIKKQGTRRALALLLTFIAIILVLAVVVILLIPQIDATAQVFIGELPGFFERSEALIREFLAENPEILQWLTDNTDLENFDWMSIAQKAAQIAGNSVSAIVNGAFSAVGSVLGILVDAVIGLVFALYCLGRKEILARQGRRILYSLLPEKVSDEIIRILRMTNTAFSNFISGQCLEAVILGCMFAVSMAIFGMPYIPLVSVLISVTALVPIVGAFVGCIVGAFFILVDSPMLAVWFVVMFLVLQQIEGNLIYPKVVGTSIGLPGMWVLVAVTVGGDTMGVAGMLIMIPLASVIFTLMREFTDFRLKHLEIDEAKLVEQAPELKSGFKQQRERSKAKFDLWKAAKALKKKK
jgi:predicted PurR-regulated permease PerM